MKQFEDLGMTPFLKKVTFFSSGGAFLDGYVLSIIGVALTQLTPLFGLDAGWTAAIGASAFIGIFAGTILGGYFTDIIGRKRMFTLDVIAIGILSIFCFFMQGAAELVVLRFLIGFFVGADYPIATSLIAEYTPKEHRSKSMGMVSASWYMGATAAAVVGFICINNPDGWRWMLGSALVPSVILLLGRHGIPESPLWLSRKGRLAEAQEVIYTVFGSDVIFEYEEPADVRLSTLFKKGYLGRVVFLGIFILCQVVPMYALYTYGPTIMTAFGLGSGHESILGEAVISLLFLAGTFPAMYWLNTFGRRPTLLVSLGLMAIGLLALGLWPTGPVWFIIIAFALYAFFSGAPGILQWLYPNELFPTEIRASAVGIAIGFSRIGTVAGTYLLPIALESWGLGPTMLVGAGLVGVGFVISYFCAPETRGKTLHEASQIGGVETRGATHHHTDGSSNGAARDGKQCQNVPGTGQVASNLTQMQAHHHHKPRL